MRFTLEDPAPTDAEVYERLKFHRFDMGRGPLVKVWRGRARKPYGFVVFNTEEMREEWIAKEKSAEDAALKFKAERSAADFDLADAMREAMTVGTLLHGSWGYDQTQCELWQVVERPSKHFACIQRVRAERSASDSVPGPMAEYLHPIQDAVYGSVERRKIGPHGLSCDLFTLSPTTSERAHYSSWYA